MASKSIFSSFFTSAQEAVESAAASDNYETWVEDVYRSDVPTRVKLIEDILDGFSGKSARAERLVSTVLDERDFQKPALFAYLHYVPFKSRPNPGMVDHLKFAEPVVTFTHKRLPMIVGISERLTRKSKPVVISEIKDSMGPKQALSYVETLSRMTPEMKIRLKNEIIEGVRSYRGKDKSKKMYLSDYLEHGEHFDLKGFVVNYPYINVDAKFGSTDTFWVHAWGTPQLFYVDRQLPVIILAGPSMRLDKNILGEKNMVGHTG